MRAENRAADIISTSQYVASVTRHQPNSRSDSQGIDLTVRINDLLAIDKVYVQVKASNSVERHFWRKLKKEEKLDTRKKRAEWVKDEGYILIVVGERSDDEILIGFKKQLVKIDGHWVTSRLGR